MYQKMLLPTDGSACSEEALSQGLDLAKALGATVTLLFARHDYSSDYVVVPEHAAYYPEFRRDLERYGDQALGRARQLAEAAEVPVAAAHALDEAPVEAILAAAEDHDLVVMGTHGRRGLNRFMLGSVTEQVLRRCQTPLLVIHSGG